jgi:hypothetical protein
MLLLAHSPAIAHGGNPDLLTYDQRGLPFLILEHHQTQTDIGAVEVG